MLSTSRSMASRDMPQTSATVSVKSSPSHIGLGLRLISLVPLCPLRPLCPLCVRPSPSPGDILGGGEWKPDDARSSPALGELTSMYV